MNSEEAIKWCSAEADRILAEIGPQQDPHEWCSKRLTALALAEIVAQYEAEVTRRIIREHHQQKSSLRNTTTTEISSATSDASTPMRRHSSRSATTTWLAR